jgi:hypothetical protein
MSLPGDIPYTSHYGVIQVANAQTTVHMTATAFCATDVCLTTPKLKIAFQISQPPPPPKKNLWYCYFLSIGIEDDGTSAMDSAASFIGEFLTISISL